MQIKGKIALVTGASTGIGRATARMLTDEGARVALIARSKDKLEALAKELPGAFVIVADLSKEKEALDSMHKAIKHFGGVDILVNNAGRGYEASVEDTDAEKARHLFDLNVITPLLLMREVIPAMRERGGGSIVNISSGTALMAIPGLSVYSSTKRALVGLSLTARAELAPDNIIVSVMYPTLTNTDFPANKIDADPSPEHKERYTGGDSPEHVAGKILEAIKTGEAEVFAREEMKARR